MSPKSFLIVMTVMFLGAISAAMLLKVPLPSWDFMPCLRPCTKVALFISASGAWLMLQLGSSSLLVMTGHTIQNTTLADFQRDCSPASTRTDGCWEHRCSGVAGVSFKKAVLLEDFATSVDIWPYRFHIVPVSGTESNTEVAQVTLNREMVHAVAVRWWSLSKEIEADEIWCGGLGQHACGTVLWGNVGPLVQVTPSLFPDIINPSTLPIIVAGPPENIAASGLFHIMAGFALLMIHVLLVLVLTPCSRAAISERQMRSEAGYEFVCAKKPPCPPSAEII
jgi:hypothetical protein